MAEITILVEAEGFKNIGGWVVDQQFMDQMGSPFLLAHGLGTPVADAGTSVTFPETALYRVLVRTRDWVAPWKKTDTPSDIRAEGTPGMFKVLVAGKALSTVFGAKGVEWHWEDGGTVKIEKGTVHLALNDLTGFDGRCDAILFSTNHKLIPPNKNPEMAVFRRKLLGLPETPPDAGQFDLVVVGGGIAGTCAAISAARLGCTVALIQNRPLLGGNNSSEVRVGLSGLIRQEPYPLIGNLVDEISPVGYWTLWEAKRNPDTPRSRQILQIIEKHPEKEIHNAGPAGNYEDRKKLRIVQAEKNLQLFLNMHVVKTEKEGDRITAVVARHIADSRELRFRGRLFADCTGDGNLGFLAGADFRVGREARRETGESRAPEKADRLMMGTSVQWYSVNEDKPCPFPDCPWAVQFNERSCQQVTQGDWDWETGMLHHQVDDFEYVRDYGLRVAYGNWSFLKNKSKSNAEYTNKKLAWVAYIGGKRESRRVLGDVILTEQDIEEGKTFPDACVTTTWGIDLHYPKATPDFNGEPFRSTAHHTKINPYPIPYRCLYSRKIENLFVAGRNISVTHVALGTVRVMRTTGMMGEVVGMASSVCRKHACNPRDVYSGHLEEFKKLLSQGVPRLC